MMMHGFKVTNLYHYLFNYFRRYFFIGRFSEE